jgi:uncharacterized protein
MFKTLIETPSRFGLSERSWEQLRELFKQAFGNSKVRIYIFGSRARGDFQRYSDLDILIVPDSLTITDKIKSALQESLEESDLPIKVDLVFENEIFDSYREQIIAERVAVFEVA